MTVAQLREMFKIGDVICMNGPSVPLDLRGKWFRVEAVSADEVTLSLPYLDEALTRRYHPTDPRRN